MLRRTSFSLNFPYFFSLLIIFLAGSASPGDDSCGLRLRRLWRILNANLFKPAAMRKLIAFSPHERPLAGLLKERLELEGIACLLRNEELFAAMGEIPFLELRPELWVLDDDVLPRARLLLEGWLQPPQASPSWTCQGCGEVLEGQFDACWKCGRRRE